MSKKVRAYPGLVCTHLSPSDRGYEYTIVSCTKDTVTYYRSKPIINGRVGQYSTDHVSGYWASHMIGAKSGKKLEFV